MMQVPRCVATLVISFLSVAYGQDSIPLSQDGDHVCTETQSFQDSRTVSMTTEYEMRYYTQCGLFSTCSRLRIAYRVSYANQFYTNYREVSVCCDGYIQSGNSCTACSGGTWGPDCSNQCLCENGGACDSTDGSCECPPGYTGEDCQTLCPVGQYGPECSLSCDCPGSCDPADGTCVCPPGLTGSSCTDACLSGLYGQDCSKLCVDCLNGGSCDTVTGLCICEGGYQGTLCDSLALSTCNCTNGGQCDEGGACICQEGYQGRWCDVKANQTVLVIQDCPEHVIIIADFNATEVPVSWEEPTAFSSNGPVTLIRRTHAPGSYFPMDSEQTVTYIFEDPVGIAGKCEFVVQVIGDTMGPIVTGCPQDIAVMRELGSGDDAVTWNEPITTEDDPSITLLQSHVPGSTFSSGVTRINYTFVDESGNSESCLFNITVTEVDTTPPAILGCPDNITQTVELGMEPLPVSWTVPGAKDASGEVIQTHSHSPNRTFPIGDIVVKYIFVDIAGNEATCTFTVSVVAVDTTPPKVVGCPGNQQAVLEVGTGSGVVVTWPEPNVTDNSGAEVNVAPSALSSGDLFPPGNTSVTYLYFDNGGNAAVCGFMVTVSLVDTVPPIILSCPPNQTLPVELGLNGTIVEWNEPFVFDASGEAITSATYSPGDFFLIGRSAVVYAFSDASGNEATCEFFVDVIPVDTTGPTIMNCPSSMTKSIELGTPYVEVTWTPPTATDLSGDTLRVNSSLTPPAVFAVGAHTVRYRFEDSTGNIALCTFNVSIVTLDTTGPTITNCPLIILAVVELGNPSTEVTWMPPSATDLSGAMLSVNSSHTPPTLFTAGAHTVSYQFRDPAGNIAVCSFDVIVATEDTTAPVVVSCPENLSVTTELGTLSKAVTWDSPTVLDASNMIIEEHSHFSGEIFPLGVTLVNITFLDGSGNAAGCSFHVRLTTVDTTPPTVENCPSVITEQVELGTAEAAVFWENVTAVDLSPTRKLFQTHASGDSFPVGNSDVLLVFVDSFSQQAICSFRVQVIAVDTSPPVISNCPLSPINKTVELNETSAVVFWIEPSATDLSGATEVVPRNFSPGSQFLVGVTLVTYLFHDSSQNPATCTFEVHVVQRDTQPPKILGCPDDILETVEVGESPSALVSWTEPTAVDLSGVNLVQQTHSPPASFGVGEDVVTYTFMDTAGIVNQCTFAVTVILVDTTSPVISGCPRNIFASLEVGTALSVPVTWEEPTATDNSAVAPFLSHRSFAPGDLFSPGNKTAIYRFIDTTGNRGECRFEVVVTLVDTTPPLIIFCPDHIEAPPVELGSMATRVSWGREPVAVDFSGGEVTLLFNTHESGDIFFPGITLVEYRFRDESFNEATCQFTVTVIEVDTTPPVIQNCRNDITEAVELGTAKLAVTWTEPTAQDISQNVTLASQSHSPGYEFLVGQTAVTYVFRDGSGNEAECTFYVIVNTVDTTPPVVVSCPSDIGVTIDRSATQSQVDWNAPVAIDLSGPVNVESSTALPGSIFPVGVTTVTYIFSDQSMNTAMCRFMVTVQRDSPDNIIISGCPVDFEVNTEPGEDITVTWGEPTATNQAGTVYRQSRSHTPPVSLNAGSTEVIYTFADGKDNQASCRFTITVVEVHALTCPETNITAVAPTAGSKAAVNWTSLMMTNGQGSPKIAPPYTPGGLFPIGTTKVPYVLTAIDERTIDCVFTVIVYDVTLPQVLNCPTDISIGQSNSKQGLAVTWSEPSATDNSGNVTVAQNFQSGDTFKSGTHAVLYQFSDPSGNIAECSFKIILTRSQLGREEDLVNGALSNNVLVTIIASSSLIIAAILIMAICLMSICCCKSRSKRFSRRGHFDDLYFEDDYFANGMTDHFANEGYAPNGNRKVDFQYDEPPPSTNSSIKKRGSVDSRRSSHYSQTLPLRPIQDPMDEGTRTIKRAYNGPVPGVTASLPRQRNHHPQLEVELQERPVSCIGPAFPPIPEDLDGGEYFEIRTPSEDHHC